MRQYKGKDDRSTTEIVLIASVEGSVIGKSSTVWMGPNAADGQVNVGRFSAIGAFTNANLIFVQRGCHVSATRKGGRPKAEDNHMCGGSNATLSGEYRRK